MTTPNRNGRIHGILATIAIPVWMLLVSTLAVKSHFELPACPQMSRRGSARWNFGSAAQRSPTRRRTTSRPTPHRNPTQGG